MAIWHTGISGPGPGKVFVRAIPAKRGVRIFFPICKCKRTTYSSFPVGMASGLDRFWLLPIWRRLTGSSFPSAAGRWRRIYMRVVGRGGQVCARARYRYHRHAGCIRGINLEPRCCSNGVGLGPQIVGAVPDPSGGGHLPGVPLGYQVGPCRSSSIGRAPDV